ncbi:uncharacterized protein G2W53_009698 [Senna tora]|uniref:Uncharacterized protein n=1 Tax=Senna tora TaxID=362788 RepID=A0A835C8N0_9FABA|nr:uncharacterized protein G2W53_009698 [Senna tora]
MGWDLGNLVAKGIDLDRRKVESLGRDPARDFCLCLEGLNPGLISILCGSESSGCDPVLIILIPRDFESLGCDHGLVRRDIAHDFCLYLEA